MKLNSIISSLMQKCSSLRFVVLSLVAVMFFASQSAFATFPDHCFNPITPEVEFSNNCDGTITADFYYNNPNVQFCYFDFFRWRWSCAACPDIKIPVSHFNKTFPRPHDQGQETRFKKGRHYSHTVNFPANGVRRSWQIKYPILAKSRVAVANPKKAKQSCPIVPEIDCVEKMPDDGSGNTFKAHFSIKNYNTRDAEIEPGVSPDKEDWNRFTGNLPKDVGQPTLFRAWPAEEFFTLEWDGTATDYRVGINGNLTRSPEGQVDIDLAFYDKLVEGKYVNRCESKPINPYVSCVYENNDGTATAWFGYESDRPGTSYIPFGTLNGGRNEVESQPLPAVIDVVNQPEFFNQGKHDGVMSATWDSSLSESLYWYLYWGEENVLSSAEALVEGNGNVSRQCAQVTPTSCIQQTADGNENGYLTAFFGYANDNNFDITIGEGPLNFASGGNTLPDPGLVDVFTAGGQDAESDPVFNVQFDGDATTSWEIAGVTETASIETPLCSDNQLPSCSIQGQTGLSCGGVTTATTLTAQGVDPEGRGVSYTWEVNCGEEDVNFTKTVSGDNGASLDLSLLEPGLGRSIAPGSCQVSLSVSDDFGASSCFVELASTACALDCNSEPIVQGSEPNNTVDECGVCRAQNDPNANTTCLDCAGTPNGVALTDVNSACCLVGELDQCGVCNGNNDTCLDCVPQDVSLSNDELDVAIRLQENVVRTGMRQLRRESKRRFGRVIKRVRRLNKQSSLAARGLVLTNLNILSGMPDVVQSCSNAALCAQVSNVTALSSINTNSVSLVGLVEGIVNELKRIRKRRPNIGSRLTRLASTRFNLVEELLEQTPTETSSCS